MDIVRHFLTQVFSCEIREIFKNTFFIEHILWLLLKKKKKFYSFFSVTKAGIFNLFYLKKMRDIPWSNLLCNLMHAKIWFNRTNGRRFKVGLSSSKKIPFICFNECPLKVMKNAFYFFRSQDI